MDHPLFVRTRSGAKIQGPFPIDKLTDLARRGTLKPEHELSVDRQEWVAATTHVAFGAVRRGSTAPPAVPPAPAPPEPAPHEIDEDLPELSAAPSPLRRASVGRPAKTASRSRLTASGSDRRPLNVVYLAGVGLVFIGFFLPWVDAVIVSVPGYRIPLYANLMLAQSGAEVPTALRMKILSLNLLYLIPVISLLAGWIEVKSSEKGRRNIPVRLASALSPLIAIALVMLVVMHDVPATSATRSNRYPTTHEDDAPMAAPSSFDSTLLLGLLGLGFYATVGGMVTATVGTFTDAGAVRRGPSSRAGGRPARRPRSDPAMSAPPVREPAVRERAPREPALRNKPAPRNKPARAVHR